MRAFVARVVMGGWIAALCLAACAHADARPAPAPAELLATVAIGPVTTLRGLAAYIEAVAPGSGEGLSDRVLRRGIADAVGVSSLDGIDPASWMYLLVVGTSGEPAIGLVARVADAKVLAANAGDRARIRRGWAVLGARPVIDRVGSYALAALATQPAPKAPSATLYVPHLLARYHAELDAARQQMAASLAQAGPADRMSQVLVSFADGFYAALGETEQVVVTIEATQELAALDLALAARPKSRLAGFVALQRPSDYALLGKLPATASPWAMIAGHLDAGPYRDGLIELSGAFYGPGVLPDLRATFGALLKATTGDLAMTMRLSPDTGMSAAQLFGVSDAAAADRAIAGMLDLFKIGRTVDAAQISTTVKAAPDTPAHDGVALRGYRVSYDLSNTPPAQRKMMEQLARAGGADTRIATFDGVGAIATGPDSAAEAGRMIDAARGRAARFVPPPALAALLAGSRARKESVVMTFDVGGMLAAIAGGPPRGGADAPFSFSLGFADRRAHVRIAAPVASVRAAMLAGKPQ